MPVISSTFPAAATVVAHLGFSHEFSFRVKGVLAASSQQRMHGRHYPKHD
jgi:hypothetical protein